MTREQIIAELRRTAGMMETNPCLDYSTKIRELSQAAYENQQQRQSQFHHDFGDGYVETDPFCLPALNADCDFNE